MTDYSVLNTVAPKIIEFESRSYAYRKYRLATPASQLRNLLLEIRSNERNPFQPFTFECQIALIVTLTCSNSFNTCKDCSASLTLRISVPLTIYYETAGLDDEGTKTLIVNKIKEMTTNIDLRSEPCLGCCTCSQ